MLTAGGHSEDAERSKRLGAAGYLLKPIRQSELREALARALGAPEADTSTLSVVPRATQGAIETIAGSEHLAGGR